jgi:Tautomerase enzyme
LEQHHGIAPTDLMVSITGNSREDWSFGYGRAQFLEGDL